LLLVILLTIVFGDIVDHCGWWYCWPLWLVILLTIVVSDIVDHCGWWYCWPLLLVINQQQW
jgi:hypothetical protein